MFFCKGCPSPLSPLLLTTDVGVISPHSLSVWPLACSLLPYHRPWVPFRSLRSSTCLLPKTFSLPWATRCPAPAWTLPPTFLLPRGPCIPSSCSLLESATLLVPGPLALLVCSFAYSCDCTLTSLPYSPRGPVYFLLTHPPFLSFISLLMQFRFYHTFKSLIFLAPWIFDAQIST